MSKNPNKKLINLNILSQTELYNKEEIHEKSSFNLSGLTALVGGNQSIYKQEIHNKTNVDQINVGSNLNAKGNIVAQTGSTTIIGSNLEANNINIKADTGSINVLNAQDVSNSTSLDKKIEVKLNDVISSSKDQFKDSFSGNTKLKVNVASATYDKETVKTNQTQSVSSNLIARNGNVILDSLTDTNIVGSNVKASDTIAIKSTIGNINVLNSQDVKTQIKEEEHANAKLNATVQNEYVETVQTVIAVEKSAEQLKRTKEDYNNYKNEISKLEDKLNQLQKQYDNKEIGVDLVDIQDLKDIVNNEKSREKYFTTAIAAATADLASKTTAAISQADAASRSAGTAGFSAGISLDVNGNKSNTNTTTKTSHASNLNANNIILKTDETLKTSVNVIGSNVIAQNNLDINTYDLNVQASQNTNSQTQDSKNVNGSVAFTMYGGGGGTAGLGYGQNESQSDRVINNNSVLKANNMSIKTSNDAVFKGATVSAKNLDLNVGNNLLVESLRDTYNSKSDGYNLNGGLGFGSAGAQGNRIPSLDVAGTSSTNAGYSVNNGMTVNKQTVLSSITANNLNVNVGGNTHIKGALVASGEFDKNGKFEDSKNLNFTTNTLTFENMSNSSYSSNQSVGGNLNYNFDNTKIVNQQNQTQQAGISKASYNASNSLSVNANKTLATLGQGNINVKDTANSSNLDLLNQDTTKINKDLYSSNVSSKVDATLDTRLLSVDGVNQIKDEARVANLLFTTALAVATEKSVSLIGDRADGQTGYFEALGNNVALYDATKKFVLDDKNKEIKDILLNPNANDKDMQIATQQLHNYVAQELKISPTEVKLMLDSQYKGFTSSEDKTVNVATNLHNNMGDIANTVFNETSDYNDLIKDVNVIKTDNYVNNRDEYSTMYGNLGQEFLNYNYSEYTGTSLNNVSYNQVSASLQNYSPTIQTNTQNFSNLDKSQGAHRQLDQNEIKFLQNENIVNEFAKIKYNTENPTQEQVQGASYSLTQQAMRQTDKAWSMILGENTDTKAQEFLSKNSPELFKVKSQQEFNDGTTDGTTAISNLSQNEYNNLKTLYQNNVPYVTETNKEGTRFLVVEDKKDSEKSFDNRIQGVKELPVNIVNYVEKNSLSKMINDGIDKVKEIPQGVENVVENTWNYLENISPTITKERMDELYMQGDAGSKVQANIQTGDTITSLLTVTGVGLAGKAILKNGVNGVDNASDTVDTKQLGLGEVKPPNSNVEIKPGQDVLLTKDDGLEVRLPNEGKFDNVVADGETTHLFTIDNNGLKVIKEETPIGGNDVAKHTNLSSEAAFGGEVKFNPDGSVTINPYSGRYGVGNSVDDIETTAKLESTKNYFESLGYEVNTEFSPRSTSVSTSSVDNSNIIQNNSWSSTKSLSAEENALNHYTKHKEEFPEFRGSSEYIEATQSFITNPPSGTLIKSKSNGDILLYNPTTNTFAVKNADGNPKTMFRPIDGMEYWNQQ